MYIQELWFLRPARCLMMLYISMKFHEKILNVFQVIEWTRLRDGQTIEAKTMSPPLSGGDIIQINKSKN